MTQEISEARPPMTWEARGVDGHIRPKARITIEPLEDDARSRVTFTLDYQGHGIGVALLPFVRRMTEKDAPRSFQRLKAELEGQRQS
jgi:Polyketide cyclase / dehydrase and lipid transport